MPRIERARQFAPYSALKGLTEALRLKEYQHEQIAKGELSEDAIAEIATTLQNLVPGERLRVRYFDDGFEREVVGSAVVDFDQMVLKVAGQVIKIENILSLP